MKNPKQINGLWNRKFLCLFLLSSIFVFIIVFFLIEVLRGRTYTASVKSSSMEPALYGPAIDWICPQCSKTIRVSLDLQSGLNDKDLTSETEKQIRQRRSFTCLFCGSDIPADRTKTVPGNGLLLRKATRPPKRFDLAVFIDKNGSGIVKRIVGLPGETVAIDQGDLLVNGAPLDPDDRDFERTAVLLDSAVTVTEKDRILFIHRDPFTSKFLSTGKEQNDKTGQKSLSPNSKRGFNSVPVTNLSARPRLGSANYSKIEYVRDFQLKIEPDPFFTDQDKIFLINRGSAFYLIRIDFRSGICRLFSLRNDQVEQTASKEKNNLKERSDFGRSENVLAAAEKKTAVKPFEDLTPFDFGSSPLFENNFKWNRNDSAALTIRFADRYLTVWANNDLLMKWLEPEICSFLRPIAIPFIWYGTNLRFKKFQLKRDLHYSSIDSFITGRNTLEQKIKSVPSAKGSDLKTITTGITIPEGEYYLLGDNSPVSLDSRVWDPPTVPGKDLYEVLNVR